MALRRLTALVAMTAACAAACSSKANGGGGGTITAGDLQGASGGGGAAAAGGDNSAGSTGVLFTPQGGSSGTGSTGSPGLQMPCGGQAFKAEPAPVDMYIMFDQSVSMADPIPNSMPTETWWQAAQQGVTAFVNDPLAAGMTPGLPAMTVGLQYFPLNGVAPQSCMADYSTPEVELGLLPGNAAALAASINKHQPTAFTPTGPAITGAIAHMKAWGPAHPGHAPVVVLVTDGFPTECDPQDITDIAAIVQNAYMTDPVVRTFVVGFNLGSGGSNLDAIATAGGTGKAFLIDKGDIGGAFTQHMLSISSSTLQCKFDLPTPPMGQTLDINMVAVTYTPSATGVEAQVPKLNGLSDCDINNGNGWFYDSPTNPTKIEVCPGTCSMFAAGVVKTSSACVPVMGVQ